MSDDHEFEPFPGLPEPLPPGERLIWQAAPEWRSIAIEVFHVRKLALYFAVLLAWRGGSAWSDGLEAGQAMLHAATMLPLALLGLGLLATLAWLTVRTTLYTLTDRRVVMRIGIVLSVTYNLPFERIASASLHRLRDGHGDIALQLLPGERVAYLQLWPHARPWHVAPSQPMLRALPQAERAASSLAAALAASAGMARPAVVEAAANAPTGPGRPLAA